MFVPSPFGYGYGGGGFGGSSTTIEINPGGTGTVTEGQQAVIVRRNTGPSPLTILIGGAVVVTAAQVLDAAFRANVLLYVYLSETGALLSLITATNRTCLPYDAHATDLRCFQSQLRQWLEQHRG